MADEIVYTGRQRSDGRSFRNIEALIRRELLRDKVYHVAYGGAEGKEITDEDKILAEAIIEGFLDGNALNWFLAAVALEGTLKEAWEAFRVRCLEAELDDARSMAVRLARITPTT